MIHKLILKNFKKIKEETFLFNKFDIIVGANNSGKSTALQALAIWQYCVEQFKIVKKGGSRGMQIVLPNFSALPLPEFNLLWNYNRYDDMCQNLRRHVQFFFFFYPRQTAAKPCFNVV